MDTKSGTQPAVVVDYADYLVNPALRQWLAQKQRAAAIVLLVTDPTAQDYDYDIFETLFPDEIPVNFAAVLRNSTKTPLDGLVFKVTSLVILQDSSSMTPVLAIDSNLNILEMYEDGGVLMALTPNELVGVYSYE